MNKISIGIIAFLLILSSGLAIKARRRSHSYPPGGLFVGPRGFGLTVGGRRGGVHIGHRYYDPYDRYGYYRYRRHPYYSRYYR